MRFDLVDLQLFLHVVEAGSITGGAARAHLALASTSERIQNMEATLGVPLLVRGRRGVQPTAAGLALQRHARLVFQQLARMRAELGEHAAGLKGQVRLLCNTAALCANICRKCWPASWRGIRTSTSTSKSAPSSDIARAVREGGADLGIVADTVDLSGLETFPFCTDRIVAVAPPALARTLVAQEGQAVAFARLVDFDHVAPDGRQRPVPLPEPAGRARRPHVARARAPAQLRRGVPDGGERGRDRHRVRTGRAALRTHDGHRRARTGRRVGAAPAVAVHAQLRGVAAACAAISG